MLFRYSTRLLGAAVSQASDFAMIERRYEPVQPRSDLPLLTGASPHAHVKKRTVVGSGMDPGIDPYLIEMLNSVQASGVRTLFFPSFKHLSRHVAKLLAVIEYAFLHGAIIVTPNYYLSNGFIARRQTLLRPIHDERQLPIALRAALVGTVPRYKKVLQGIARSYHVG